MSSPPDSSDYIMVESNAPSASTVPTEPSSAEIPKKHKPDTATASSTAIDFSFLGKSILPHIDDEEIVETGSFTWEIKDFKALTEDKERSPVFSVGGWDFNMLLFPKGNTQGNLALYLEPLPKKHLDETTGEMVPDDPKWYVCAQFTLIISNPRDPKNNVCNTSHQRFSKHATDWGFSNMIELRSLYHSRREVFGPLLDDNKLNITAYVKVLKDTTGVLWHSFLDYDSKKETGFVGFTNQGATCYLNSLLQSYFFTKSFRKAVYQIPTEAHADKSVPLELQKIFYELQTSDQAVDTSGLTAAFGWEGADAFQQHDVQELNRILMDKLEISMKGTPVEDVLAKTFVGKVKSFIKCIDVDYESSKTDDFWDIQLNVKNLNNLNEAFQNYVEAEILDGENQYRTTDYGLQDAKKGDTFVEFPTVLHLQLKRFEYNFEIDALSKINDRYEFPESIDLSPYLERKEGEEPGPCIYDLHGVLVHAGDITNGHYYTMIKPDKTDKWFRFDDDRVWRVTHREVFEENFGHTLMSHEELITKTKAEQQAYIQRRHTSAYMLVYIKRSELDRVLEDVPEEFVPEAVREVVSKEIEDRRLKRKEEEERHLYLDFNIYTNDLFKKYQGFDIGADERLVQKGLYDQEFFPTKLKVLKTSKFKDMYPLILEKTGVDPKKCNLWSMTYRRNHTLRPNARLPEIGDDVTIEEVYESSFSTRYPWANIWLEDPSVELKYAPSKNKANGDALADENDEIENSTLLFLKYFDVSKQSLTGVTHVFMSEDDPVSTIVPAVKKALGLDEYELEFFEEISTTSVERVDVSKALYKCELGNGDILTVQKALPKGGDLLDAEPETLPFYGSADQFYMYLGTRCHIKISPMLVHSQDDEFVVLDPDAESDPEACSFDLWISSHATYEEFAQMIGKVIKKDAKFLRLYVNYNGNRGVMHSNNRVGSFLPRNLWQNEIPQFEYELLSVPLVELEKMYSVTIHWLPNGYCHYVDHTMLINLDATIQDLIDKLQTKVGFSDASKDDVLLWCNSENSFTRVLVPEQGLDSLDGNIDLFAAILPEETRILKEFYFPKNEGEEDTKRTENNPALIRVIQYFRDTKNVHGISFLFPIYPDEALPSLKERMQRMLGLGQKEFAKVNFSLIDPHARGRIALNSDDIVLYDTAQAHHYLGLDLADRTSRTGGAGQHSAGIKMI